MSQSELARHLKMDPGKINEICRGASRDFGGNGGDYVQGVRHVARAVDEFAEELGAEPGESRPVAQYTANSYRGLN